MRKGRGLPKGRDDDSDRTGVTAKRGAMEPGRISPFLSAGLFFFVHAVLLALCGWIKSWWNEPLGIDGFLLFVVLSFIIQRFCPRLRNLMSRWP